MQGWSFSAKAVLSLLSCPVVDVLHVLYIHHDFEAFTVSYCRTVTQAEVEVERD